MRRDRRVRTAVLSLLCSVWLVGGSSGVRAAEVDEKTRVLLEALNRLEGADLEANAALKAAVMKALSSVQGAPEFVGLVKKFHLQGQGQGLLEAAWKRPDAAAGVEAIRMVLDSDDRALIPPILTGKDLERGVGLTRVLGNSGDQRAVEFLLPIIGDQALDVGLRKQAVVSAARMKAGASALLSLAREGKLAVDLRFVASSSLNQARWPEISREASELMPAPLGRDAAPLPPVSILLKTHGDAARGEKVFLRQETACSQCHRIGDKGKDFGPALSEIGSKLGKDALYEAILDPSSGISFDYEAWEIETRSGDEFFGIIVNETAEEVTIKDAQAIPTRIAVKEIARRRKGASSIMPAGLQMTMSTQELVDLVEYLFSRKAASPSK